MTLIKSKNKGKDKKIIINYDSLGVIYNLHNTVKL